MTLGLEFACVTRKSKDRKVEKELQETLDTWYHGENIPWGTELPKE